MIHTHEKSISLNDPIPLRTVLVSVAILNGIPFPIILNDKFSKKIESCRLVKRKQQKFKLTEAESVLHIGNKA